jgi:cytochrome P450
MLGTVQVLLSGGLDTVAASLGFWTRYLAQHPEQRGYIRSQRDNLQQVINELMRRFSVPAIGRIILRDAVYKGIQLRAGDRLIVATSIHNMDACQFARPDQVDFSRRPRHLGFGAGTHTCVGASLARCEFKIFLEEWLSRIPDFELCPGPRIEMRTAQTNVIENLWIRWNPDQAAA